MSGLEQLLFRLQRSRAEADAYLADREGHAARAGLDDRERALLLTHLGAGSRAALDQERERHLAAAASVRDAFPHTIAQLARERDVGEPLLEALLLDETAALDPDDPEARSAAFVRIVGSLPSRCDYLGDLAALERAVHAARSARDRFARFLDGAAARYRFTPGPGALRPSRLFPTVTLGHDLPWRDFPAHLSARPPAVWPDRLPRRLLVVTVGLSVEPPHHAEVRALDERHVAILAAAERGAPSTNVDLDALAELLAIGRVAIDQGGAAPRSGSDERSL